jgi:hypothetical protein
MKLGKTWKKRQRKYRQFFAWYLKEYGLQKRAFPVFGIGSYRWYSQRKEAFRAMWKEQQTAKEYGSAPP